MDSRKLRLQAVIFDLDGVVADSHPIHLKAWKALLQEQGFDVSALDMEFLYAGRSRNDILRHYFGHIDETKLRALGLRKDELYRSLADELQVKNDLLWTLDQLDASRIPYALATSAGKDRTMQTLEKFKIKDRFAAILAGDDVRQTKPAPDVFLKASEKLAVPPEACLVIEDSVAGVQASRAARMTCLGYAPAERALALRKAGAIEVVSEFPKRASEYFRRLLETDKSPAIHAPLQKV